MVKGDVFRATDKVAGLQPHLPFKYSMEHGTLKCNNHVFSKHQSVQVLQVISWGGGGREGVGGVSEDGRKGLHMT